MNSKTSRNMTREPTVTSSPIEIRLWIEELDYSFLVYGENFERAGINGEKLFNITRQKLTELGIIRIDHQDIILKAVSNMNKTTKVEEQLMQPERQHDKKMATRFQKQSEHLERATERVRVIVAERREARTLRDTNEQPPHSVIAAALDLINVVETILNILQRPPLDCMSEFSSLKLHLIKHISLLNYFCEQSDLNNEMESDMIDVCKGVTKMCNYIMELPPEVTGPEEMSPAAPVPIAIDPELMSFSVEHGPGCAPPTESSSVPIALESSLSEHAFLLQDMSLQSEIVSCRAECLSPEILDSPSEGAVMMPPDKGEKSKTEFSDTKDFDPLASFWGYESFPEMSILKYGFYLPDSEKGMLGSDSDRGSDFDDDSEDDSKDSYSPIWGMDSDSETCPGGSDPVQQLLERKESQLASGSAQATTGSERRPVGGEQFQLDYDVLRHWMESDSEIYLSDSDIGRPDTDSDAEKCPVASGSAKHATADKCQLASDSVQRLIESQRLTESKQHRVMAPASEKYGMDSDVEADKTDSAPASGVQLTGKGKRPAKTRLKSYAVDSASDPRGKDSNPERHALATVAAARLLGAETGQLGTDAEGRWGGSSSEGHTVGLDSESRGTVSDPAKHLKKARSCQSEFALEAVHGHLGPESETSTRDSDRQHFGLDSDAYWDSSASYEYLSARFQTTSERCQVELQRPRDNVERHQLDSESKKRGARSENEQHHKELESERPVVKMERAQCLMQPESERLQMEKEQEKHGVPPDSGKEHGIAPGNESRHPDTENEERLGARKKTNRPPGFWRPLSLLPSSGQAKKTEEKYSVQQTADKGVSGIQPEGHLSDEKTVRCKEVSPTVSDKQASQEKLREKCSPVSPDPNTLVGSKDEINAGHQESSSKSSCQEDRQLQSSQSSQSQIHLLDAEDKQSEASATDCHPTSMSPQTQSDTMDTRATICSKCFMETNNSSFHKCLGNSNTDSDSDCSVHLQSSLCSKYGLSPRPVRQGKTSQESPLSEALDLEPTVGTRCPKHRRDCQHASGSASYLHCENCVALQSLIHSTVTDTFPMSPESTTSHHSTSEPDNTINVSNVIGLESEVQFHLTTQLGSEANSDHETELVSGDNLKKEATTKDKPLLKDEKAHEDESDSEDETDSEDEEDDENKDNTKDEKDPKDKSDRDDDDPKGSSSEKDADTNRGSDPSGDADQARGAGASGDGNSDNGTDRNGSPDSNTDKGTNDDANSKPSTDSQEEKYTNNLDNASGLDSGQHRTADLSSGADPNHAREVRTGPGMDGASESSDGAGLSGATRSGSGTATEAGPNDSRPGPNLNESVLQNNGPGPQNNRQGPNLPGLNNSGSGLDTNPVLNNNSPGPDDNVSVLENDPDFNNNARPYHASHNSPFSSNKDIDSNYDTDSTSDVDYNYSAVPNYFSDLDCVLRFIHIVGSSFVVNLNNITKISYAVRPSSTSGNGNVSDGGNSTSCRDAISPSYVAFVSCASDAVHETGSIHVTYSIFFTTPNYDAINTTNAHNSTSTTNITFSEPKLEVGSSFSVSNAVYDGAPTFAAGTNYPFTPENVTTCTSFDLYQLGGNYTSAYYCRFGVCPKAKDGCMDSSFMQATESKCGLDAKESGLSKYFSNVQNPIGIKDPSSLNFHYDSNILLLSFDIIVEAEQPDVVKFAISSGAVNQFVKSLDNYYGNLRAEEGSLRGLMLGTTETPSEGCAWGPAEGPSQESLRGAARELRGGLSVTPTERSEPLPTAAPTGRHGFGAARGFAVSPGKDYFDRYTRAHAVSPTKGLVAGPANGRFVTSATGLAVTHAGGYAEGPAAGVNPVRAYVLSPAGEHPESPSWGLGVHPGRGYVVSPIRSHSMIPARERAEGPAGGLAVHPGRGYAVGPGRRPASAHPEISTACAVRFPRGYAERQARQHVLSPASSCMVSPAGSYMVSPASSYMVSPASSYMVSPASSYMVSPAHGLAGGQARETTVNPAITSTMRYTEELILGSAVELTVKPAEGYTGKSSKKSAKQSKRSATDGNHNRSRFPISKVVSVIPNFHKKRDDGPEKFIYFRPLSPELQEEIRRQSQQMSVMAFYPCSREGRSRPRTPRDLWLESSVNAEFLGNDGLEGARSRYPFRERPVSRHSWKALLDAPLNREGLHVLRSGTAEKRAMSHLPLPPQGNRATALTSGSGQHLRAVQGPFQWLPQNLKFQRQHSHSLSQYSDIGSQNLNTRGNAIERSIPEESWQRTAVSASAEYPIHPGFANSSVMRGRLGIPGDRGRYPRVNVGVPMGRVGGSIHGDAIPMENAAVPLGNFGVRSGISMHNLEVPRSRGGIPRSPGTRIPTGQVESLRSSVGTSTRSVLSPLLELLKIGEHQV